MEFIESIRKDQVGLGPLVEQKICHYFNAAFQQLTCDEQENAQVSVKDTRVLLNTVIEGTKRAIDLLTKRSEQFIKLHRPSQKKSALHSSVSQKTVEKPAEPKILDAKMDLKRKHKQHKVEKYLRPHKSSSVQSFP